MPVCQRGGVKTGTPNIIYKCNKYPEENFMWQPKNNNATNRRIKTANESIEYCYQKWVAEPKWIIQMRPKGSEPAQKPYRKKTL